MNRMLTTAAMSAIALSLVVPAGAIASSAAVIRDCSADGSLEGNYSQGELQGALNGLPSDLDEYTDCRSVIRQAALAKAGGKGGDNPKAAVTGVDRNSPANPDEQRRIRGSGKSGAAVKIGGEEVKPGGKAFLAAAFNNDVPTLLVAVLVLFSLALIGGSLLAAQRRWPEAMQTAGAGVARPFRAIGRGLRDGVSRFKR
jgi:hypothetical protein